MTISPLSNKSIPQTQFDSNLNNTTLGEGTDFLTVYNQQMIQLEQAKMAGKGTSGGSGLKTSLAAYLGSLIGHAVSYADPATKAILTSKAVSFSLDSDGTYVLNLENGVKVKPTFGLDLTAATSANLSPNQAYQKYLIQQNMTASMMPLLTRSDKINKSVSYFPQASDIPASAAAGAKEQIQYQGKNGTMVTGTVGFVQDGQRVVLTDGTTVKLSLVGM